MQLWDGFNTDRTANVMVLAATNRPYDLDDAVLRRWASFPAIANISLVQSTIVSRTVMSGFIRVKYFTHQRNRFFMWWTSVWVGSCFRRLTLFGRRERTYFGILVQMDLLMLYANCLPRLQPWCVMNKQICHMSQEANKQIMTTHMVQSKPEFIFRFTLQLEIPMPDAIQREAILGLILRRHATGANRGPSFSTDLVLVRFQAWRQYCPFSSWRNSEEEVWLEETENHVGCSLRPGSEKGIVPWINCINSINMSHVLPDTVTSWCLLYTKRTFNRSQCYTLEKRHSLAAKIELCHSSWWHQQKKLQGSAVWLSPERWWIWMFGSFQILLRRIGQERVDAGLRPKLQSRPMGSVAVISWNCAREQWFSQSRNALTGANSSILVLLNKVWCWPKSMIQILCFFFWCVFVSSGVELVYMGANWEVELCDAVNWESRTV